MATKKNGTLVIYIHGQGGSPAEAENYRQLFPDDDLCGLDYQACTPWEAQAEFPEKISTMVQGYDRVIFIAVSIGAYFAMIAGIGRWVTKAYFISPIVNMERLIMDMISWAGTSEAELREKEVIPVDFGEDLSWEYLTYVRCNKVDWHVPTEILWGSEDHLQSRQTMQTFAETSGAGLTVMEHGPHWLHTPEQLAFVNRWLREKHTDSA